MTMKAIDIRAAAKKAGISNLQAAQFIEHFLIEQMDEACRYRNHLDLNELSLNQIQTFAKASMVLHGEWPDFGGVTDRVMTKIRIRARKRKDQPNLMQFWFEALRAAEKQQAQEAAFEKKGLHAV